MPACTVLDVTLDVTSVAFNRYVPHPHGMKLVLGGNSAGARLVDPGAPSEWCVSADYSF